MLIMTHQHLCLQAIHLIYLNVAKSRGRACIGVQVIRMGAIVHRRAGPTDRSVSLKLIMGPIKRLRLIKL